MTNLLKETEVAIAQSGHVVDDITFIGSQDGRYGCKWPEFKNLADVEYDSGYGASEVATDLIIRFNDGKHMWRGEYDGSEWWEYDVQLSEVPGRYRKINKLVGGLWRPLEEMNKEDSK